MENKLCRAIRRSQRAYEFYLEKKLFYQALRIYKANLKVYTLLEDFSFSCDENILDQVFMYIFHLEDWFESFHAAKEKKEHSLTDKFVFEDLPDHLKFPSDFVDNLQNNKK